MDGDGGGQSHNQAGGDDGAVAGDGVVVIERRDDGWPKERGDYKCTACGWEQKEVTRPAVNFHIAKFHPGRAYDVKRMVEKKTKPRKKRLLVSTAHVHPKVVAHREAQRDHFARKKVRILPS